VSTVTYPEAMAALGVSLSTVQRRLRITRVPTEIVGGRTVFDLETLVDAWDGHRAAMEAEKAARENATEASITVSIPRAMRDQLEEMSERHGVSLAAVVREVLGSVLN
jgi:hypothetical protein